MKPNAIRFSEVRLAAIGYELPGEVVTSAALEERLAPLYAKLRIPRGQLEGMTGIRERRWWPATHSLSGAATRAGVKALAAGGVATSALGAVIYGGVCRENLEPATACAVADGLGVGGAAQVYDISNACLGVLNGMVQVATAIEAGQMRAGLIVSCETARPIVELTIQELLAAPTMERFKTALATLTGGSGAVAVLLAHADLTPHAPRLLGGVIRAAPQHHRLCRWGPDSGLSGTATMRMETHAVEVMQHGVQLGVETWRDFVGALPARDAVETSDRAGDRALGRAGDGTASPALVDGTLEWARAELRAPGEGRSRRAAGDCDVQKISDLLDFAPRPALPAAIDRVICHQVGASNRDAILAALAIPREYDFSTFEHLGNIGTVSLPITLALAAERGFLQRGQRVGLLGIGSGLNCLMLGVDW